MGGNHHLFERLGGQWLRFIKHTFKTAIVHTLGDLFFCVFYLIFIMTRCKFNHDEISVSLWWYGMKHDRFTLETLVRKIPNARLHTSFHNRTRSKTSGPKLQRWLFNDGTRTLYTHRRHPFGTFRGTGTHHAWDTCHCLPWGIEEYPTWFWQPIITGWGALQTT